MELLEGLRSTASIREFEDRPVPEVTVRRVLDTARFAPNGGNRQAWRVVLLDDSNTRRRVRDIYVEGLYLYRAQSAAGLRPWAPVTDRGTEAAIVAQARATMPQRPEVGGFAEHFDRVPVLMAVLADLRAVAALDRDLGRYTIVGGASIYPFVWSILLAARAEGLGGVMTTMATHREPEVLELLGAPDHFALASIVALGWPQVRPTRLTRVDVDDFVTVDTLDGRHLEEGQRAR